MVWIFLIALALHILCCVFAAFAINTGLLKVHRYMFFVVLFLPLWGIIVTLVLHFQIFIGEHGNKDIQVEKLKLESEIYKGVTVESKRSVDHIVPLEEALIINTARERREIIMDVLNDNPKEYIEFLQKAGNNDDTEVVHYAVTAMVEISKENDYALQQFERKYAQNPDDFELLDRYCDFLWEALEQNLMQGQVEIMNRNLFNKLVTKKLGTKETMEDYIRLVKNCFCLENYTLAGETIEKLDLLYPETEEVILIKLQYYGSLGMGEEIQKLIKDVEERYVYLSAKAKEAIVFWKN